MQFLTSLVVHRVHWIAKLLTRNPECETEQDSNTLGGIAAAILKTGISTFRFDFAGNG